MSKIRILASAKEFGMQGLAAKAALFENSMEWMNSREAANYLRISANSLRIRVLRKQVGAYKFCGRLMFKKSELERQIRPLK
jgi:hypothetical protein